jgi:hypothetical protein
MLSDVHRPGALSLCEVRIVAADGWALRRVRPQLRPVVCPINAMFQEAA